MSLPPHAAHLRDGQKMGDLEFVDTMIKDGLWDAFNGYHMGITAENVAGSGRSPARSRTRSPPPRRTRRKPRRRPASSRTRSRRSRSRPARARRWSSEDEYIRHGAKLEDAAAAPGLRQGRHRHRRQRLGPQ